MSLKAELSKELISVALSEKVKSVLLISTEDDSPEVTVTLAATSVGEYGHLLMGVAKSISGHATELATAEVYSEDAVREQAKVLAGLHGIVVNAVAIFLEDETHLAVVNKALEEKFGARIVRVENA